jgi:hypothetical protein
MSDQVDRRIEALLAERRLANRERYGLERDEAGLKGGGGGGTSGGMEARIARLESDMEHVKKGVDQLGGKIEDVRSNVGELRIVFGVFEERSKTFPTKGFIFTVAASLLAAAGALMAIVVRFVPHAA